MPWTLDNERPARLRRGEAMSLDEAWLCVERGRVWVTLADDPVDYFVDGGHVMRLPRGRRAVLSAELASELRLRRRPPGAAGRLAGAGRWVLRILRRWLPRGTGLPAT